VTPGKRRVLVTGASGFIGRPLVAALDRAGSAVRAAVRDRRGQNFPSGVEVAALPDLAAPIDWSPLVGGMDAVVHLAGIAHVGPDFPESAYDRVNHLGVADLARASAAAGVKHFVLMSSIRAQTGAVADHPLSEADLDEIDAIMTSATPGGGPSPESVAQSRRPLDRHSRPAEC